MNKLKIAVLVEIFNYHSGARAPLEIAKHLHRLGHTITVYGYDSLQDPVVIQDLKNEGIQFFIIKRNQLQVVGKLFSVFPLFKMLKEDPPQIVCFAGTLPFFIAAKFTGLPIILTYYGSQLDAYLEKKLPDDPIYFYDKTCNLFVNFFILLINFILVRFSTRVVAISNFSAQEARKYYGRMPEEVIYLGATPLSYKKHVSKHNFHSVNLLSVSRITPYKGFHIILNALRKVNTKMVVHFTIAGSPAKERYLTFLKKHIDKNMHIALNPTDESLADLYNTADIYLNADRYLYFGLPILEAAYLGKPTVSFNFAAASELIIHNRTGFIAQNKKEFAYYTEKLIEDEKLRKNLGKNARALAKKFSWEKCALGFERLFINTLKIQ